jgi:hypothetical protein
MERKRERCDAYCVRIVRNNKEINRKREKGGVIKRGRKREWKKMRIKKKKV